MTAPQRNNIVSFVTIANFVLILGFVWQQAQWQQKTDSKIEVLEEHAKDQVLHMPFDKKIQIFVPRVELEGKMNAMQYSLDKIEKKLDKLK